MTVVGTAEVLIVPNTAGFATALEAETGVAFGGVKKGAEKAGEDAGKSFEKGTSTGLSKLANVLSSTFGIPLLGASRNIEKVGSAVKDVDSKSSGLAGTLDKVGGVALVGVGIAAAGTAVATVKLAEGMETADAAIASAEGTSKKFAANVGNAFLSTAGKSEFSGETMARAFGEVAGQLKTTEGHALSAGESLKFMTAAGDLATAKQIEVGNATSTLGKVMQAFGANTNEAAHYSDVLYSASNETGVSVEALGQVVGRMRSKLGESAGSVGNLSALIVDMTKQGITGRTAVSALSSGLNGLQKTMTSSSTASVEAREALKNLGVQVYDANGKFVGMGSVITQLHPIFDKLTQKQQIAAATTLFGAGAARQMLAVINAGPAAFDAATKSVEKHGAAQKAASAQAETLHGELRTEGSEIVDLGTKIGEVLIPIVLAMTKAFVSATSFVLKHKETLIALGILIGGALTTAITVFTINKMAAFGASFVKAGQTIGLFKDKAVAEMATVDAATTTMADTTAAETGQMELDLEAAGASAGALATDVTAADATIEEDNAAAAASFLGMVGPLTIVAGAVAQLGEAFGHASREAKSLGPAIKEALEGKEGSALFNLTEKQQGEVAHYIGGTTEDTGAKANHRGTRPERANTVAGQILSFWESKGFSPAAAAGFVGNAAQESKLNPSTPGGGLYQQSGYPSSFGEGSVVQQSQHVLENLSPSLIAALKKAKTPQEAANLIAKDYEKPKGSQPGEGAYSSIANIPHREQEAINALTGGGPSAASTKAAKESEAAVKKASKAEEEAVKKELAKQTADKKAGEKEAATLQTAIQSQNLKTLVSATSKVHEVGFKELVKKLDGDHSSALKKLAEMLQKTWEKALKERGQEQKKAEEEEAVKDREAAVKTQEEADRTQSTAIGRAATLQAAKDDAEAQQITDATKVMLDKQAEVGLSGTAEISARLQTVFDEVTSNMDKAIGDAKIAQDEQAGKGAIAEAEAAARVTRVEGEAKIKEAEAQRQLELAKNEKASNASGVPGGITIGELHINGTGLSAGQVIDELGWALRTGKLPTAEAKPS